jgi:hypothetical protein
MRCARDAAGVSLVAGWLALAWCLRGWFVHDACLASSRSRRRFESDLISTWLARVGQTVTVWSRLL